MTDDEYLKYRFIESEWKKHMPTFSLSYLATTFPEAEKKFQEMLRRQIDEAKADLVEAEKLEKAMDNIIYRKIPKKDETWWRILTWNILVKPLVQGREELIKTNTAFLNRPKDTVGTITDDMITRAKEYPISELMEFKSNVALCPYHNDKRASFTYYPKTNSCWCFSCMKHADSIDLYRQLHGGSFLNAVKRLQ